jgi:ribosomal protein L7/L12
LFNEFLEEARKDFPKLAAEIETRYNSKLGFNDQTRQLELVTQALARYVNKKYKSGEKGSKLSKLIDQLFNYIGSLYSRFVGKFTGKDHDFDDIKSMKLSELADIVLAQDSKFHVYTTQQIQYAISSRQQAAQDESQRLIVRMNVLYRQYEKMKDKTPSQQKIADRIFETLNKLKQHRDIAAVGIALEQAKLSLGQYDETIGGPATMQTANIYDYLYRASQNNFDGVTAKQLVDMYRNTIKFYSDLIEGIPSE